MFHVSSRWLEQKLTKGQPLGDAVKVAADYAQQLAAGPAVQHLVQHLKEHAPRLAHGVRITLGGGDDVYVAPVVSVHVPKSAMRKADKASLESVKNKVEQAFPGVFVSAMMPHPHGNTLALMTHPKQDVDVDDIVNKMFELNVPEVLIHNVSSGKLRVPRVIGIKGIARGLRSGGELPYKWNAPSSLPTRVEFPDDFRDSAEALRKFIGHVSERYGSHHEPVGGVFHLSQL